MDLLFDYFDDDFRSMNADYSEIIPFSHANVIVNCNQPLSNINGKLERRVEEYLNHQLAPLGIKARWDRSTEWYQLQERDGKRPPRISRLGLGINFDQ